jgi:phospholipid/cholesterol/gamma-HCH transport system substrate-binding protein
MAAKQRNELKAGAFIVVAVVLIVGIVVGVQGVQRFIEPSIVYTVRFQLKDDVSGLARGADVQIGGVKVGTVRDVAVEAGSSPGIVVKFALPARYPLKEDAKVSVLASITGVPRLNIEFLGVTDKIADGIVLNGTPGGLSAVLSQLGPAVSATADDVRQTVADIRGTVGDIRGTTVPKVNRVLDTADATALAFKTAANDADALVKHVHSKVDPAVEEYNKVAANAQGAMANIRDVFGESKDDFKTTVANVRAATGTLKERLPGMLDRLEQFVDKTSQTIESARVALEDVKAVAENTKVASASVRSLLTENRGRFDTIIKSIKSTGLNLDNASAEIRRSPWRLLYQPKEAELSNLQLFDAARQFAAGAERLNEASLALRDALSDPATDKAKVEKLLAELQTSFTEFSQVERGLWQKVKE